MPDFDSNLTPYYEQSGVTLYHGDVLETLRRLPDESVNCCITSPPYWGLRSYNVPDQIWGGDAAHAHAWGEEEDRIILVKSSRPNKWKSADAAGNGGDAGTGTFCECGAWRGSLGLEPTPYLFVEHIVMIFEEVRRVLRPDATCWVNFGDSYASQGGNGKNNSTLRAGRAYQQHNPLAGRPPTGLKPKDLCGVPWRVAFALQDAGWWLRSDIIWAKFAPMPESVTDRPTRSHEYIFLLAKSERYFYDAEAIKEPAVGASRIDDRVPAGWHQGTRPIEGLAPRDQRDKLTTGKNSTADPQAPGRRMVDNVARARQEGGAHDAPFGDTRNKRDVWNVNTDPFPEAHFATFPPALILPCVLAGCPAGGVILDPFSGAGTTALVAKENGRRAIGIELNEDYLKMSERRLSQDVLFS